MSRVGFNSDVDGKANMIIHCMHATKLVVIRLILIVGVPTRGPGSQLVNAACFLVLEDDARGNHSNARFILVPATGPYVQQRGCARALYYLALGVLVVGGTSKARVGGRLPSLC